jgi:Flp pilus assembly protein TadD
MWVILLLGIYTLARIGSYWYADTLYANGYRLIRAGLYGQAIPALNSAIALNQREPIYHDELANGYATLSVAAFESNNATQAAQLASLATEESMKALAISPRNVNFYKTRTKVYYTLSSLDPSFNAKAVEALEMALTLSPNDPKIYYNLAILVGRDGDITGAISYLLKAKELKPNYRDVYYALWVFYTEEKKPADARAILEEYLTKVDPNDTDFQERLK